MGSFEKQSLEPLYAEIGDPTRGLPYEVFLLVSKITPLINVDLLIRDERGRILLTWRDDEIHGCGWHIPGGIIRFKETAESRIIATAQDELGATVSFGPAPVAVDQFIEPERAVRGHLISLVYECRLTSEPDARTMFLGGTPKRGEWVWHSSCPPDLLAAHRRYARYFAER